MTRYTAARKQAAKPAARNLMKGSYSCPELGRTCQRPGAYDAFDLPSLYGTRLHYPDGRVARRDSQCAAAAQALDLPIETVNEVAETEEVGLE